MIGHLGLFHEARSVRLAPIKGLTRDLRRPRDARRYVRKRWLAIPHWLKFQTN